MPQEEAASELSPELSFVNDFYKLDSLLKNCPSEEYEHIRRELIDTTLAYVKEFNFVLDAQLPEPVIYNSYNNDYEYDVWAREFVSAARQLAIRFKLRQQHGIPFQPLRAAILGPELKVQVHNLVSKIRKILNQLDLPEAKRSELLDKLNAFAREVDQQATKKERLSELWLSTTKVIGEGFENLNPAAKLMERIGGIVGSAPEQGAEALPAPEEAKSLPAPDSDIPF